MRRFLADGVLRVPPLMRLSLVMLTGCFPYRELYRPDWMHLIRSQAFANLWMKAYKAHEEGLVVVRAMGTDELHVLGEWRRVFPEGRGVSEVKVKDTYTVGCDTDPVAADEHGD